ncbi:MAG: DUF4188 domain-containing protein [Myxococcales bacterium]|nr:DUF4188 domain-containing protein [Myxococcales bacterium]
MVIRPERLTVVDQDSFVVFLIGARVNKWWMLPILWAVSMASNRMMKELQSDPSSGLLSHESFGGRTSITVQYWRSLEHLHAWAHDKGKSHRPAWKQWAQRWGLTGAMGIWHETYVVQRGQYECVYQHMPAFGLGKVGELVDATGGLGTASQRLAAGTTVPDPASAAS